MGVDSRPFCPRCEQTDKIHVRTAKTYMVRGALPYTLPYINPSSSPSILPRVQGGSAAGWQPACLVPAVQIRTAPLQPDVVVVLGVGQKEDSAAGWRCFMTLCPGLHGVRCTQRQQFCCPPRACCVQRQPLSHPSFEPSLAHKSNRGAASSPLLPGSRLRHHIAPGLAELHHLLRLPHHPEPPA